MGGETWPAKSEIHLNHPYLTLIERTSHDGTTVGDRHSWPGFHKPITFHEHAGVNAYRVINPTAEQTELPLDIVFTTGGKRTLEFVDSEYRLLIGVTVQGMKTSISATGRIEFRRTVVLNVTDSYPA